MKSIFRRAGLALATALVAAAPAWSQAVAPIKALETYNPVDANGVNLLDGSFSVTTPVLSIGPKGGGLSYSQSYASGTGWKQSVESMVLNSGRYWDGALDPYYTVSLLGQAIAFKKTGSTFAPSEGGNATLTLDSGGVYTLVLADGTTAYYSPIQGFFGGVAVNMASLTRVVYPNGREVVLTYANLDGAFAYRLQSVTSSDGYQLHFDYMSNTYDGTPGGPWRQVAKATALNNAVDACAANALTCSYSRVWPSLSFTGSSVTDALGRTTHYLFTDGLMTGVRRPGRASGQDLTVYYNGESQMVEQVTTDSGTWTYAIPDGYKYGFPAAPLQVITNSATQVTDPLGHTRVVTSRSTLVDIPTRHRVTRLRSAANALGKAVFYNYNTDFRLASIVQPEGNGVGAGFDARGNVTKLTRSGKTGSGLTQTTATATYPAACDAANFRICNQPATVTDANNNTTTFTYDPAHGGVTSVTSPAPSAGGVQPQVRTTYAAHHAWFKSAAGPIVPDASATWLPIGTSQCISGATCAGTADEVKTTTTYQAGSASQASNLLPASVTRTDGIGAVSATTTYTYDPRGVVGTVDGPLAGTADTTRTYYDDMLQATLIVGPDPDGAGALLYQATRTTYNADGQVTDVEAGTTTGQADASPATFVSLQDARTVYDVSGRKVADKLLVGGVVRTLTEYAYDAANRPICTAVRMSPLLTQPSSACTPRTNGQEGLDLADRITYTEYDAADRETKITSGYGLDPGLDAARVEKVTTYTDNGKVETVADGKGNLTTYQHDGYDRLFRTRYPNASGGGSSTTDLEELGYDPADNVTSRIKRRPAGATGSTVTYVYDALGRLAYRSDPQGYYYYDNLGRPTFTYSGASSEKVNLRYYDALGNPSATWDKTPSDWRRTTSEVYDLAGRRVMLQWADNQYVVYVRDTLGRVTSVWQNGASILTQHLYDDLGRQSVINRVNGAYTYYAYDAAGRLGTLTLNLPGTAQDQVYGFTYNAAGQIKTRSLANTSGGYLWTPGPAGSKAYTTNGLNQYAAVAGASYLYDARGNLTSDGASGFGYDLDNRLTAKTGGTAATLGYDPLARLDGLSAGGTTTRLFYLGSDLTEETDANYNTLRRYVPGPEGDQPLVWYEGAGLSDRRFLLADERGSIVAVTNDAGAATTINAYDEYGVPAAGNLGRFQYTGQVWLPEVGLYHYKARAYSPTLGRFLQTDPTGYDDGLNWYAYVGNDPVNRNDPTGLFGDDTSMCGSDFNVGSCSRVLGEAEPTARQARGIKQFERALDAIVGEIDPELQLGPNGTYRDDLAQIAHIPAVYDAMKLAWDRSKPYGNASEKNEHGFWAYVGKTGRVEVAWLPPGKGASIDPGTPRSSSGYEYRIFFHTHPFTKRDGLDAMPSSNDWGVVRRFRASGIVKSHLGIYYYGY